MQREGLLPMKPRVIRGPPEEAAPRARPASDLGTTVADTLDKNRGLKTLFNGTVSSASIVEKQDQGNADRCKDPAGGRKPINAKCETVRDLPTFRDAYRKRRCIVPVDGFFEWQAVKGQKAKQPYAIAMKDGAPFGLAGVWENWKEPASGEWMRTFAIITIDANELIANIHDRMPLVLGPQ